MEFPRLVYKSASVHHLVEDEKQLNAALDAGWFATVPEALSGEAIAAKQRTDVGTTGEGGGKPTRAELEQKATELGIPFSAKVSDKKLGEAIAAKLAQ